MVDGWKGVQGTRVLFWWLAFVEPALFTLGLVAFCGGPFGTLPTQAGSHCVVCVQPLAASTG
jgi:hypothetical protein